MDFFQSQDSARKNTTGLVLLFVLAVLSLVILTNLLVMAVFGYVDSQQLSSASLKTQFDWPVFLTIGAAVMLVVGIGSLYKISVLSRGGEAVAEMLGGELIVDGSGDLNKQKVLNVVEEMAIASGTPVPPVYLLSDEEGINAFAAGFGPGDAVIGVTRGCIEKLSREQLQGVIAHEFSHILNGDMRLNIRLMGILHGILVIGIIGHYILRSSSHSRYGRSSRNRNAGGVLALGLGLMVIGYSGMFFGNLIKAAVSRQREYLADASAVQFTRNPNGIAGALKRIGGDAMGSHVDNPAGAEISHAFFAQGVTTWFAALFATHPPLAQRIQRIEPNWDGQYDSALLKPTTAQEVKPEAPDKHVLSGGAAVAAAVIAENAFAVNQTGQPDPKLLNAAQALLQAIPPQLNAAVHEPYGARAVIYMLLLDNNEAIRHKQLAHLRRASDDGVYETLLKLCAETNRLEVQYRLPLLDLTLPALRQLSQQQYQRFRNNIKVLIEADAKVGLFEWSLQKILFHHLDAVFVKRPPQRHKYASFKPVANACSVLLSTLIHTGQQQNISAEDAFNAAKEKLGEAEIQLIPKDKLSLSALNGALDQLNRLKPLLKPRLLKACAAAITADNHYSALEAELYRAIADTLDCPMPPVLL